MPRTLPVGPLLVASLNAGKAREVADLFAPLGFEVRFATDLALSEPAEDAEDFIGNAALKALAAARATGLAAVADDSGLVVPALGGAPGVRSRRFSPTGDYAEAMARVHAALGERSREAEMVCALALAWPDGHVEGFEGRVGGHLVWPPRGELGFGYEPMFAPDGSARTYGEQPRAEKLRDDPRARAFAKLRASCLAGEGLARPGQRAQ
ncbi:MAG: non-canonical purine NTP pyrophosphatase [Sandaracinaceae bacterium]|nr:non-canonical purine NTP pyrophosphatase [Sandaracinaceae bacterium]